MINLDSLIEKSNGKFVSVRFIKKDGTIRNMTCRLGVTKHLKGGVSTLDPSKYLTVYDVVNGGYRAVNRATIVSVTFEGVTVLNNQLEA